MSKVYDGLMGLVVGDAMGVPFEFDSRDSFEVADMTGYGTYNLPAGIWSDDSSMMLATVESITIKRKIDIDHIMNNFVRWVNEGKFTPYGKVFDIGRVTRNAIQRYVAGIPAEQCGGTAAWDNSNGSLMRILPLAFTDCDYEMVNAVSSLTHGHDISKAACRIYTFIARQLLRGKTLEDIFKCFTFKQTEFNLINLRCKNDVSCSVYFGTRMPNPTLAFLPMPMYEGKVIFALKVMSKAIIFTPL